jgi:S-formylglutathione hydrolase FrmB
MKKYTIIFLVILAALILTQCSKRENPLDTAQQHGRYWSLFYESNAIKNDKMQDFWYRNIVVYTPPGYDPADTLRPVATGIDHIVPGDTIIYGDTTGGNPADSVITIPPETTFVYGDTLLGVYYPVLYLLHGYGGTHTYFKGLYDVGTIMDELINAGQIQPMIVVTPNATNNLGGSFYTNSDTLGGISYAGKMQDFITDEVVHIIDSVYNTIPDRNHRGIGGHSMGGYGAIKMAMLRNDLFGSASAMSAPITFWGDYGINDPNQFDGVLELMPAVFAENGFTPGDTVAFYHITPSPTKRVTSFMFAMGAAFSPNWMVAPVDTTYAHRFNANGFVGYIDLPFDVNGNVAMSVWAKWLSNDVATLFTGSAELLIPPHHGVFDSTALYFDAGSVDDLGMQYHAQVFDGLTSAFSVNHQYEVYPSSGGSYIADHTFLIADRIRKIAKFHSDAFSPIVPTN